MDQSIVSSSSSSQETPTTLQEPTQSKSLPFLLLYGLTYIVLGMGSIALTTVVLPAQIAAITPSGQTNLFALIVALGAVASLLANPLVGMMSDRTTFSWGKRRTWFLAGGLLLAISLALLAVAHTLLLVAIEWVLLSIGIGAVLAALSAILPDQVPLRQRATVSAVSAGMGLMLGGLIGQILVAQVFKEVQAAYFAFAVISFILLAAFLLVLRDAPLPKEQVPPLRLTNFLGAFRQRDFTLTWFARCLVLLGYTTTVNFLFYFLQDAVHYTRIFPGQSIAQGVQTIFLLMVGSILVASLVSGIISDKLQLRKGFVIVSGFTMSVGLLLYALFPLFSQWTLVLVATAFLGIGVGVFFSVDLALSSQVLPTAEDRGRDIGIINSASYVPMVLAPAIAGITLGVFHSYLSLFVLLAVGTVLAALLTIPIKSVR